MKKILLSSVALTSAACAFAAVNVESLAPGAISAQQAPVAVESVQLEAAAPVVADKVDAVAVVSATAKAGELTDVLPRYEIPAGAFYLSGYMSPEYPNSGWPLRSVMMLASPNSSYKWVNTSINATAENKFTWSYLDIAATEAAQQATFLTVNTVDYESSAANAFLTYSSTKGAYATYAPTLQIEGVDSIYNHDAAIQYGMDTWTDQLQASNQTGVSGFRPAYNFNFFRYPNTSYANITGFHAAAQQSYKVNAQVTGDMVGYGLALPKPEAQYGLSGVTFKYSLVGECTTDVRVNVYELTDDGSLGEILASGKLAAKDVPYHATYWSNAYVPMVIEDPDLGDVNTTVNIDRAVCVVIEAVGSEIALAGAIDAADNRTINGLGTTYYVAKDDSGKYQFMNVSGWGLTNSQTGDKSYFYSLHIGLDVTTSFLNTVDGNYTFNAPVIGGTKTFEMDALYNLSPEAGVADIYGEGLDEWYTVMVNDDNNLVVNVKALPQGVAGRSSEFTVYTPGSQRVFTVNQGDNASGVADINAAETEVIANEYYDLQGRKLNAEPENGLFIQKSILSNGKTVAAKVVK